MTLKSSTKLDPTAEGATESRFLRLLHATAHFAVPVGALSSVGLMLYTGHRNPSRILIVIFALWVLSPFMALALASVVSKSWSVLSRATIHSATLVLTLGSFAIYAGVASGFLRAKAGFVFLVVPSVSWLFTTIVVLLAALLSGRRRIVFLVILCVFMVGTGWGALCVEHRSEITLPT